MFSSCSLLELPIKTFRAHSPINGKNLRADAVDTFDYPRWVSQMGAKTMRWQGISPVSKQIVWVSGTGGQYAKTLDGGTTWQINKVAGADSLEFRDVHAISDKVAFLMSSGNGATSRIYKTTDGGISWDMQFRMEEPKGFLDCISFWDEKNGLAMGDSIDEQFYILKTNDGGTTWQRIDTLLFPPAYPNEGGFASSGTCLITKPGGYAWFGTGASGIKARVLHTRDFGASWEVNETPIFAQSNASGIFSLVFTDTQTGFAFGGDINQPNAYTDNVAVTYDGGYTWELAGRPTFPGAIYGASAVPFTAPNALVVVGPKGSSYSTDDGRTWKPLGRVQYWATAFVNAKNGWAVGPNGTIVKIATGRN